MSYTMYTPLNVWLDPASMTDVVAYIQTYLRDNPIYSTTEIETLIHDYLIAHPELIGGVQSVNGKTGTVVLSASDINTENNVTIESVLSALGSQISTIAANVATNTNNITSLTGRVSTAETDLANLKSNLNEKAAVKLYKKNLIVGSNVTWYSYKKDSSTSVRSSDIYSFVTLEVSSGTTYYIFGKIRFIYKRGSLIGDWSSGQVNYVYTADFTGDLYVTFFNTPGDWVISLTENIDDIPGYNTMPFCKDTLAQEQGRSDRMPISQKAVTDMFSTNIPNIIGDEKNLLFSAIRYQNRYYDTQKKTNDLYDLFTLHVENGDVLYIPCGYRFLSKDGENINGNTAGPATYTADFTGNLHISFNHINNSNWIVTKESDYKYVRPYDAPSNSYNGLKHETGQSDTVPMSQKAVTEAIANADKDVLTGKKWAVCGDSFTNGVTSTKIASGKYSGKAYVYPYLIGNRTGLDVIKFFGGGRTLAFPNNPESFVNSLTCPSQTFYYQNIPEDVDYITIYLGINDEHHAPSSSGGDGEDNTGEIPLGTIMDGDPDGTAEQIAVGTSSYYGAWNVVLSWLIENRPNAHIGIIVSNGIQSKDEYRQAQIAIATKYGIPYIDLNGDHRTPAMLRTSNPNISNRIKQKLIEKWRVSQSDAHPNDSAHEFESIFIESFLRSL